LGWCYSYGPPQGPDSQKKKQERGLKQRSKQKEAAQGDPEPKKGNQEKGKNPSLKNKHILGHYPVTTPTKKL
jgi:hypothetical protein